MQGFHALSLWSQGMLLSLNISAFKEGSSLSFGCQSFVGSYYFIDHVIELSLQILSPPRELRGVSYSDVASPFFETI